MRNVVIVLGVVASACTTAPPRSSLPDDVAPRPPVAASPATVSTARRLTPPDRSPLLLSSVFDGYTADPIDSDARELLIRRSSTRIRIDLEALTDAERAQVDEVLAGTRERFAVHPAAHAFDGDDTSGVTPNCNEEPYSIEELLELIDRSSPASLAELLESIPDGVLQKFTFVHTSRSLHADTFSRDDPRVIRFSTDGTLALAYPLASGPEHERLEVASYDLATDRWHLYDIEFRPRTDAVTVGNASVRRDSPECLSCHGGDDPRPNWSSYFTWSGVYGTHDDLLGSLNDAGEWVRDAQSDAYLAMRRRHADNPKFTSLPWPDHAAQRFPYVAIEKLPNYNYRPNAGLTIAFSRLAARRLARRISSHPDYGDVRIALAREALGCETPEALAPFVGTHGEAFAGRGYDPWQQFQFNASSHTAGGALLYAVASSFGVKSGEWSLEFQPSLEGDHALPIYVTASWSMPQFVQGVLLEPLLQELELLEGPLPTTGRMATIFGEEFSCVDDLADRVDLREADRVWLCDELEARQGAVTDRSAPEEEPVLAGHSVADAHCMGCHESLPTGARLLEAIRPDARGTCRMPLGRACLSESEREALLQSAALDVPPRDDGRLDSQ